MILPELPAYLSYLGGEDYKGLIIGLFTLTAAISRPLSGKLTDTIGRIPVMIIGSIVCVLCSASYPIFTSVFGFLFLRLLHGFSTGFKPTASIAYIADIVPHDRRGEAIGVASVSGNLGLSAGPILGSTVAVNYGLNAMFITSSVVAVISVIVFLGMKETLQSTQKFTPKMLIIKPDEIINFSAVPPAIVTFLVYMPYGVILTIIPDQCDWLGIENKGTAFAAFTASSILSRLIAGKASDKIGRINIIYLSAILLMISLLLTGFANNETMLYIGMAAIGFSLGIGGPAVFAWSIDRCSDEERGRAMGTVYIALEAGIGIGAVMSAWIYNNTSANFEITFQVTAIIVVLAVPYLFFRNQLRKRKL